MTKRIGVLIMRLEPRHRGHNQIIQEAARQCNHLLILIGSVNRPRSVRNPWTYMERWSDLRDCLPELIPNTEFSIYPLNDYRYSNQQWVADVENSVRHLMETNTQHFAGWSEQPILFGHTKPDTWYLNVFPHWEYRELNSGDYHSLNATEIRELMFSTLATELESATGDGVISLHSKAHRELLGLTDCSHATFDRIDRNLIHDWRWLRDEKMRFLNYPYEDTLQFNCADAIVECAGHVLTIKRGNSPGKGVHAWPGGFKNANETFLDCIIRELDEETNLRVPEKVLRGSIVKSKLFDDPHRGLGIPRNTVGFHFRVELDKNGEFPRVTPGDDGLEPVWLPFGEFLRTPMHDDHQDMGYDLIDIFPVPAHLDNYYVKYSKTI